MIHAQDEGEKALTHVVENVFQLESEHPLALALDPSGYKGIRNVIDMDDEAIKELKYKDDNKGNEIGLSRPDQSLLLIFIEYYRFRISKGTPVGDDWTAITAEDYNHFRMNEYVMNISSSKKPRAQLSVTNFKKSVKRDSSVLSVPPDDAIIVKDIGEASQVSKGMEKIPESTDEFSVMSMDTSIFVSPISQVDDAWLTIARDSMLRWDKISRDATLHW
jgi:hypothetical protein